METLRVWVRVHQVVGLPEERYKVHGEVRPLGLAASSACHYDRQSGILTALSQLDLCAGQRHGSALVLAVRTDYLRSAEACRLTLPLRWFPADQSVRDWFPVFAPKAARQIAAQIEVHIVKRHPLPPFAAPEGRLLVLPAWSRPGRPIAPPTPYFGQPPGYDRLTIAAGPFPGAPPLIAVADAAAQRPALDDGFYDLARYPSVRLIARGEWEGAGAPPPELPPM
jgi:hypothetical protein